MQEEPGGLQSMGLQRVGQDLVIEHRCAWVSQTEGGAVEGAHNSPQTEGRMLTRQRGCWAPRPGCSQGLWKAPCEGKVPEYPRARKWGGHDGGQSDLKGPSLGAPQRSWGFLSPEGDGRQTSEGFWTEEWHDLACVLEGPFWLLCWEGAAGRHSRRLLEGPDLHPGKGGWRQASVREHTCASTYTFATKWICAHLFHSTTVLLTQQYVIWIFLYQ